MSEAPRILIVDDEPLARKSVARQVAVVFPDAEVQQAADGFEALELVARYRPMLVFLDVEMPELSGFDVLRQLAAPRPKVIFVTAYSQFALEAFEQNACDYLLKPHTPERFAAACARASVELDNEAKLLSLESTLTKAGQHLDRFALHVGARVELVPASDVSCLVSKGHYSYIYARDREYLSELSLAHFEARLDPARFVRVHRSAIINLGHIRRVTSGTTVELDDGQKVPLSRRHKRDLMERIG